MCSRFCSGFGIRVLFHIGFQMACGGGDGARYPSEARSK